MTSHEFEELLDRYSRGECTPEEEAFVTNWYNAIDNDSRKDLPEEFEVVIQARALARLKGRIKNSDAPRFTTFFKIAAAVALLIVAGISAFFAWRGYGPEQIAGKTLPTVSAAWIVQGSACLTPCPVTLPDGSRIVLQPGSELRYPEHFTADRREVYLTGEAFFDVRRDTLRPFLVYSNEVTTRVLGTSFTITAYSGAKEITVAVKTGRVSVYKQPDAARRESIAEEVILAPNQQAVYNRDQHHVSKALVSVPHIVLEKPTLFAMEYDGMPVVKILQVLEENYGIDIVFDEKALEGCALTTSMADEGLYERIKIICEAIGARYMIQGTTIVIESDGCNG